MSAATGRAGPSRPAVWRGLTMLAGIVWLISAAPAAQSKDADLPELTQTINDFASVVDARNTAEMDRMIRALQAATGDAAVVATVPTIEPYGDIREYANKLFGNHGRGIGQKGKNNGLLILLAVRERKVWIEVGYDLEQWVTDGFSGETSRLYMVPEFREGRYGDGLRIGVERVIGRIAQGRNVTLQGVRAPAAPAQRQTRQSIPAGYILLGLIILLAVSRIGGGPRGGVSSWGRRGWSGWSSGVGPFGGGWGGGGGGGGGFGGGFGGFGGGSSGGGGGGSSW
ncbi:MAG: TPM domain-containing protein [Acidobacteriota bacterium]